MKADERQKPKDLVTPPKPEAGAHHGPSTGPGFSEALSGFTEKLKQKGIFNYRILGILLLVVVGVLVWRYIASTRASATSRLWVNLDKADTPPKLEELAKSDSSGTPGKLAVYDVAKANLGPEGIDLLSSFNPDLRKKAIENIEAAREALLKMPDAFKGDQLLLAQIWQGLAKAEVSLVGIPKEGQPTESRGSLDKAIEYFGRVAEAAGSTPMGDDARKSVELLKQKGNILTSLQAELNTQLTPRPPTLPTAPLGPIGSTPPLSGLPLGPDLKLPSAPTGTPPKLDPIPTPTVPPKTEPTSPPAVVVPPAPPNPAPPKTESGPPKTESAPVPPSGSPSTKK